MESPNASILQESKLPNKWVWAVVAVSVMPIVLHLLGVDFGSPKIPFVPCKALALADQQVIEALPAYTREALVKSSWLADCRIHPVSATEFRR